MKLLFREHGPFTPNEIFQKLGKVDLDLATVYRTINALEAAGILIRCEFGDDSARFEFHGNVAVGEHHHHIMCRKCKKIVSVELCLIPNWKKMIEKMGYRNPGHLLEFFGTCAKCDAGE
jgi:Fur family ferric uptake transcriptional regulator